MNNKKLEQLYPGMEHKNYKALCEFLEEPIKSGKSKTLQLKQWQNYFTWTNLGNKIIISTIKVGTFDYPVSPYKEKTLIEINGSQKLAPLKVVPENAYSMEELVRYFLNEELAKGGNKYTRQRAELECCCKIVPQGNKWLVKEIYEVELERTDKRETTSIFLPKGEINKILLLLFLRTLKENGEKSMFIAIPTLELYALLGLTNSNFACLRYEDDWIEQLEYTKYVKYAMNDIESWMASKMLTMSRQLVRLGGIGASKVKWKTLVVEENGKLINVPANDGQVAEIEYCEDWTIKEWNRRCDEHWNYLEYIRNENGEIIETIDLYTCKVQNMFGVAKYLNDGQKKAFYEIYYAFMRTRDKMPSGMQYCYSSYAFSTNSIKLEKSLKKMGVSNPLDMTIDEIDSIIIKEVAGVNAKHVEVQMKRFLDSVSQAQENRIAKRRGFGKRAVAEELSYKEKALFELEACGDMTKLIAFILDNNHDNSEDEQKSINKIQKLSSYKKQSNKKQATDFNELSLQH